MNAIDVCRLLVKYDEGEYRSLSMIIYEARKIVEKVEAPKPPPPEPKRTINQHPAYELAKSTCPRCHTEGARHYKGAAEYDVVLECVNPKCVELFGLHRAAWVEIERRGLDLTNYERVREGVR